MSEVIGFDLPWPPSVNHYYFTDRRTGRRLIGNKGRAYKKEVSEILSDFDKVEGFVSVKINLFVPDRRKRDVDNVLKCLLDSMGEAGVYDDDSMIVDLRVRKIHSPTAKGVVGVKIQKCEEIHWEI